MESVLLVIHLIVALSIIVAVLVQPSEAGGFLGSSGSMSNLLAPRRKGDGMTRLTTILAGIFFLTSLSLAVVAEQRAPAKSILDVAVEQPAADAKTEATKDAAVKDEPAKEAPKKEKKPSAPLSK